MSDVFLSYSREDRPRIAGLVRALEGRGLSVWWDAAIPGGVAYSDYIQSRLDESRCVLVVWSKISIGSYWVKTEAAEGLRRGVLLPVLIDPVEQPLEFRRIQATNLLGWNGNAGSLEYRKLCDDIDRVLQRASPDPVAPPAARPRASRRQVLLAGTGLVATALVAILLTPARTLFVRTACSVVRCDNRVVVGVMEIAPDGDHIEPWWCDLTRDMLNATLNKFVGSVSVVSKQEIDFVRETEGVREIEAARRLGIDRMVSGTLYRRGGFLILQLQVVEPGTGRMRAAREARGTDGQLEQIQNEGAVEVLKALDVQISSNQLDEVLRLRSTARLADYKLLADSMGGFADDKPADEPPPPRTAPRSGLLPSHSTAYAAGPDEMAVEELLERYRRALESEDLGQVAAVHVELTDRMRTALTQYFANARELHVQFDDVTIRLSGDEALASFTRKDEFRDAESGREVRMELRVSSVLERHGGAWRIRGLKRSS